MDPMTLNRARILVWATLAGLSLAWTIIHATTDFHLALAGVAVFSFAAPAIFMDRAPQRESTP